jgi:septal ring-binding cell division protein DamX
MNDYMTVLKIVAIALVAAVLVVPSDALPIPFGTRVILLGALAIGSALWVTSSEEQRAEEEREREANEARWKRQQEQAEQEHHKKKDHE